ncbi:ECF transporter S component [Mycoplasmopsis glycophila]|uniref:Folate ECF transporter S component FolT n=1 Tax=Mycoplasmopsis glycophila TaxID=171285 RepID=A0A449AWI8_9BACT|nr:ECF transporter S component [Mycoplasmopsis glycophila]VEU71032.1 Folate ECF transporter S component FolT [Mycoplasmopsis glycophila]
MKEKLKIWNIKLFPKWTIRKMAFVAILIAISVAFTIISAQIVPLVNIQSYKFSFIGLPIKISGFIFGPFVGLFVGIVSDFLSLLFIPPAGYNPVYTVAIAVNGIVSGIFGFYFVQFIKNAFSKDYRLAKISVKIYLLNIKYNNYQAKENFYLVDKYANKIIRLQHKSKYISEDSSNKLLANIYLINGVAFLLMVAAIIGIYMSIAYDRNPAILNNSLIRDKTILLILMISGILLMVVFIIIGRFTLKLERYTVLVPIIVFSAFLELINTPILSVGDVLSLGSGNFDNYFFWVSQHILTSPIKIWFNMFVIYYSYMIVSKLINKNSHLTY